ncbi:MAG: hypothetical protein PHH22_01160 [Clostridia bacterium]|nr:hypothetical protein [Clostridia bacterium]
MHINGNDVTESLKKLNSFCTDNYKISHDMFLACCNTVQKIKNKIIADSYNEPIEVEFKYCCIDLIPNEKDLMSQMIPIALNAYGLYLKNITGKEILPNDKISFHHFNSYIISLTK